jgi:hypothetical protein
MSPLFTFQLLTTPRGSGDNFGTLIRISRVASLRSQYTFKGVQIQEGINFQLSWSLNDLTTSPEVLNELHRSQESGYNMRDGVRQNHLNRAKICSKIIKYPHLEDYAVRALLFVRAEPWLTQSLVVGTKRTR